MSSVYAWLMTVHTSSKAVNLGQACARKKTQMKGGISSTPSLEQLSSQGEESGGLVLSIAVVEAEVVPLNIAEGTQPLLEGRETGPRKLLGAGGQHTHSGDCPSGWAVAACGAVSRLKVSVTMHPTMLHHMVVSSRQPHADLLLSMEAVACTPGVRPHRHQSLSIASVPLWKQ